MRLFAVPFEAGRVVHAGRVPSGSRQRAWTKAGRRTEETPPVPGRTAPSFSCSAGGLGFTSALWGLALLSPVHLEGERGNRPGGRLWELRGEQILNVFIARKNTRHDMQGQVLPRRVVERTAQLTLEPHGADVHGFP